MVLKLILFVNDSSHLLSCMKGHKTSLFCGLCLLFSIHLIFSSSLPFTEDGFYEEFYNLLLYCNLTFAAN